MRLEVAAGKVEEEQPVVVVVDGKIEEREPLVEHDPGLACKFVVAEDAVGARLVVFLKPGVENGPSCAATPSMKPGGSEIVCAGADGSMLIGVT